VTGRQIDILIGVREADGHVDWLRQLEHSDLPFIARHITISCPTPNTSVPSHAKHLTVCSDRQGGHALLRAKRAAALAGNHLLILLRAACIGPEVAIRLTTGFAADPMIGWVVPRFTEGEGIIPLPPYHLDSDCLPRAVLATLPSLYLAPEFLCACVLVNANMISNVPNGAFENIVDIEEALFTLLIEIRRRGFRGAIQNHVFSYMPQAYDAYPSLPTSTVEGLSQRDVQFSESFKLLREMPWRWREAATAAMANPYTRNKKRRLIFDCKGLPAFFNGTADCILGILDGLASLRSSWEVEVLVTAEADAFHGLQQRYRKFDVVFKPPRALAEVAIRLSQPWDLSTIAELHRCGLRIGVNILDTIAWDIITPYAATAEKTWKFCCQYLDALLFISHYTQARFAFRFPIAAGIRQLVTHLSFNAKDYMRGSALSRRNYILLFGNDYPHKAIDETLTLLKRSFPFQDVIVVGGSLDDEGKILSLPSGRLSEEEICELFGGARILLFPSYYEGFGLPVVKGLYYGNDVIVRRSALIDEIAAQCRAPGRLHTFNTPAEMVELIGRVLSESTLGAVQQGAALRNNEEPLDWAGVAQRVLTLAEELAEQPGLERYDLREAALRLARPNGLFEAGG
jgi:glycosyltransferase involved in cell wall biosynthesis